MWPKSLMVGVLLVTSISAASAQTSAEPQRRIPAESLPQEAAAPRLENGALLRVDKAVAELTAALLELESQKTGIPLRQWVPPNAPGPYWPFPQGPWEPWEPGQMSWRVSRTSPGRVREALREPSASGQNMEALLVGQLMGFSENLQTTTRLLRRGGVKPDTSGEPQPAGIVQGLLVGAGIAYVGCVIHVEFHEGGLEGPRGFNNLKKCLHDRLAFF